MALSVGPIGDLYGQLTPDEQSYVRSSISSYVPEAVDQAASAIEGLGPAASQALQGLQSGDAVTGVEDAIPLVSGALALIPGVGLAAAGVVAAGGELFGLLADALHLGQPPADQCGWVVGQVCFAMARPYGPTDPSWVTIEKFSNTTLAQAGSPWHSHNAAPVVGLYASWLNVAFDWPPFAVDTIGWELWALGDHVSPAAVAWRNNKRMGGWIVDDATGQTDNGKGFKLDAPSRFLAGTPAGAFLMAYYRALVRSWEFAINGYQLPDPYTLFLATAAAWNREHSSASTFTFDGNGQTWIDGFLNGNLDGKRKPPVTINTGPASPPLTLAGIKRMPGLDLSGLKNLGGLKLGATPASSRVGATVVTVGAVGAVGAGVWVLVRHLAGSLAIDHAKRLFTRKPKP